MSLTAIAFAAVLMGANSKPHTLPSTPPVNTDYLVERRGDADPSCLIQGNTCEAVSIIFEHTGKYGYPWPVYVQLTSNHDIGDAVGVYVRMFPLGGGWYTSFHAESFEAGGTDGATIIGYNYEVTPRAKVRNIGINLQSKGKSWELSGDAAVNVQGFWKKGIDLGELPPAGVGINMGKTLICWDNGVCMGPYKDKVALYRNGKTKVISIP